MPYLEIGLQDLDTNPSYRRALQARLQGDSESENSSEVQASENSDWQPQYSDSGTEGEDTSEHQNGGTTSSNEDMEDNSESAATEKRSEASDAHVSSSEDSDATHVDEWVW